MEEGSIALQISIYIGSQSLRTVCVYARLSILQTTQPCDFDYASQKM